MIWISGLFLLGIALLGGGLHAGLGKRLDNHMPLVLAFGGAFLIGLIFTHLVPEAYAMGSQVGIWVLVGFILQIALEYLSQGLEHGHAHHPKGHAGVPWGVFISLCLHAFLESMPLAEGAGGHDHAHDAAGHHHHIHLHGVEAIDLPLLLGLALHKLPVALVLMSLLSGLGLTQTRAWLMLIAFGLMPISGMLAYEGIIHGFSEGVGTLFPQIAHGLLIGILMHISTTILFEMADGHRFNARKFALTLIGLGLSVAISSL